MKKLLLLFTIPGIFLISSFLSFIASVSASSPHTISYQGRLRESGQPVSGIRNIQFKLFDAASAGTPVFDSDPQSLYVSSGIFAYQLGSNKAAGYPNFKDLSWATSSYWLEISVGGNAMSPREQINAMPYAFMSSTAASLNGSGNIQITGAGPHYVLNGNVGIGTTGPTSKLNIKYGNLEASSLHEIIVNANYGTNPATVPNIGGRVGITFSGASSGGGALSKNAGIYMVSEDESAGYTRKTGLALYTASFDATAVERLRINSNGNVGIGTTNPSYALEVSSWVKSGGRIMDKYGYVAPVGSVQMYASTAAPAGWMLCDGSAVSRTTYAELYEVIGITFGGGDGSTTFNLPDCRGIFIRGAGTSGKLVNSSTAAFSGTLGLYQIDKFQGHQHATDSWAIYSGNGANNPHAQGYGSEGPYGYSLTSKVVISDGLNGLPRAGSETNPANLGLYYIIKY